MEQLTGLDATFLYVETPRLHMHVSMAAVLDPSTVPGGFSWATMRQSVGARLARAAVFRRRLVEVPFRLGHPYWVDDRDFDLDYHLRRAALPAPGGLDELADFVGDVSSRQLDRSKPLWEMYLVEGLEHGRIALVAKVHHSTIDGVSGAGLLAELFDLRPDAADPPVDEQAARTRDHVPSELELVLRAMMSMAHRPVEITKLAYRTGRSMIEVRRVRQSPETGRAALPLTAPRTSLNAAVTPHRKVAFITTSLEDVKLVKRAVGTTVNDVILAICAGALRRYLAEGDELPEEPLVASIPVSVHTRAGERPGTNKVSVMWVALPCLVEDPVKRLLFIRDNTKNAKSENDVLGADVLLEWAEYALPNAFSAAARAYTRLKLAERHRPIHSMIISNIPGPDFPLYLGGAELEQGFPLGPVMDGAGLNITVMSYRGSLNWGLIACSETVPRLRCLAGYLADAAEELLVASGVHTAARHAPASRTATVAGESSAAPGAHALGSADRVVPTPVLGSGRTGARRSTRSPSRVVFDDQPRRTSNRSR